MNLADVELRQADAGVVRTNAGKVLPDGECFRPSGCPDIDSYSYACSFSYSLRIETQSRSKSKRKSRGGRSRRQNVAGAPVEAAGVVAFSGFAPRLVWSRHGEVLEEEFLGRGGDAGEAVAAVDVVFELQRRLGADFKGHRKFAVVRRLHHAVEVVIATRPEHEVGDGFFAELARKALEIVDVPGEIRIGNPPGRLIGAVDERFEFFVSTVVVVRRIDRVLHGKDQRLVGA